MKSRVLIARSLVALPSRLGRGYPISHRCVSLLRAVFCRGAGVVPTRALEVWPAMQADPVAAGSAEAQPLAVATPERALPAWKRPFLAMQETAFRRLWLATLPGVLAMQMDMVVTGYVAYDISGAAAAIGVVSLGATVPMMLLGLFGGAVADRFPKRRVLTITQGAIGLAALINAVLVLSGVVRIWHLVLVAMLQGVAFAFNMPARQAFIAQLVSRERLTNAIALHSA
ncbi:MAG: hypothetical protein DCC58_16610, partial [Chloroflexi bacterium]